MEADTPIQPPLHSFHRLRRTYFNRVFAPIYTLAIIALLYHHLQTLLQSHTFISISITISLLIAHVVLAFMWLTAQSFRMNPIVRQVFPENLNKVLERNKFPGLDIFICTADPYKEPPLNVVNTALSVMAYDYPADKISVYVSDDGGSQLTLFAFMEAAKFARSWLPFCVENDVMERCPDSYFKSHYSTTSATHDIKVGFRYGSLVEDYYTGYRLQCEGWHSLLCHPERPAFLGDIPISLNDLLNQNKRWCFGLLEVGFSKYSPLTYGVRALGPLAANSWTHYACWPAWSIPITIYAFLPQLALLNNIPLFPKTSDPWFMVYAFMFVGAYVQDCMEFILDGGTLERWWSDQRMWIIRGLSSYVFGTMEYLMKHLGIATHAFNVTSKVVDDEQSKRYDQGMFEFGAASPMFVPLSAAAILNLIAFLAGFQQVVKRGNLAQVFVQMFITGFGILNALPIYKAMFFRSDKGRMPTKITVTSIFIVIVLYVASYLVLNTL